MAKTFRFTAKSKDALLYFFRQRLKLVIVVIILGFLYSFAETFSIGMLFPLLSQLIDNTANVHEKGKIVSFLFKTAESMIPTSPLFSVLIIFFIAIFFKNIFGYFREVLSVFLGLSVRKHCQTALFHHLLRADYHFFIRNKLEDLEYRVLTAPNQMNNLVAIIPDLIADVSKCILIISLLYIISPEATLVLIILGSFFFLIIRFIASRVSYFTGKARVQASSDAAVYCGQALHGIKMLRVFKAVEFWETLFNSSLRWFYSLARRDAIFAVLPARLMEIIVLGFLCFAIGWIVNRSGSDNMAGIIPGLGVFILALQRLLPSMNSVGRNSLLFMSMLPYGEATYDAMRESYKSTTKTGRMPARFESEIFLKGLSLEYEQGGKLALDNISFSFRKNLLTAIVGESGSGKTSILNLLLKILEPTSGKILIDGVPLKDINNDEWYSRIGYVGQEVFMFNGTIRENVLFGMNEDDDRNVYKALGMANAIEFVEKCDRGLDTVIGDNGIRLSGGQRQRIAIARALLRKPDILIFDEATSAVDNITERYIKDTIKKLHNQITIINVAHRFSTIMDADEIVVLKDGRIVETGDFTELYQEDKYFKKLYELGRKDKETIENV